VDVDALGERAEAAALLERHRAGEPGIAVGVDELLAALGLGLDQDPPGAAPAEWLRSASWAAPQR
jgi:hypothetical protein